MENDQRLTPLPTLGGREIHPTNIEYSPGYTASYDDSLDGKRSIRQYINIVYKRLPIIIALTIVVTAVVALYQYQQPSIYAASTQLIIEPRKPPQTAGKEGININFGDDQKYYNTQLELLKNPDLMKRVVIALGLQRDANAFNSQSTGLWAGFKNLFTGGQKKKDDADSLPVVADDASVTGDDQPELSPEENMRAQMYAGRLAGSLTVTPQERTSIVNLTVTTENPFIAAKVVDKTAELFKKEDEERETAGARDAYRDLGKSIEDLKATIEKDQNEFIDLMTSSNLPLQEKGGDIRATDLGGLITSWRQAQTETGKLQAQYDAAVAAGRVGDLSAAVVDNAAISGVLADNVRRRGEADKRVEDIDKKIEEREQRKSELLAKYTEQYSAVKAVQSEIDTLKAQRERFVNYIATEGVKREKDTQKQVIASLGAQLSAAKAREGKQYSLLEAASNKSALEGQAETRLTGLKDELKNNRDLLNIYTQRQKEQELALASDRQENIKIQGKAVTPGGPIGPPRNRNIMVAFLISLAAGVGLAFLLDYLDDSVRTSEDVSRHLGLPTLALIPHYLNTERRKLLSAGAGDSGPPAVPSALITLEETHSPMAEAYRHLRTSLLFSSAGKPPQTILITSSQPSEGKTTTAVNTAITLAQADADVIIVDCDLRRPRLHTHFGLENTQGLTNYLSGDKNTENLIRPYADLPRLKIITSGPIPPNPAELLSSNEMRNLLTFLSGKFKHVIIDSPPAISFTDASILATLVDGVVLVAMANKSSIHLMRQFKTRIHNIGARIYGVVLNGIKSGSVEYDYYGSGYYKYYSQADDDTSTPRMDTRPDVSDDE